MNTSVILLDRALLARVGLTDFRKHLAERTLADVEELAALDAREFAGADLCRRLLIRTDDAGNPVKSALDRLAGALLDELEILLVGRGGAGKIPRLEDLGLLGVEQLAETLGDILSDVYLVETRMAERIDGDLLAALLHLGDDVFDAGAFGDENVDAVDLVHDRQETGGFRLEVDLRLRHVNRVNVLALEREIELGQELGALEHLAVVLRRLVGEPSAVAAHDLVHG